MFGKLQDLKKNAEEVKQRLNEMTVDGEVENGAIKVTSNGNRVIREISIDKSLLEEKGKEELEELLVIAVNKALEEAEALSKSELRSILPNIPGLNL